MASTQAEVAKSRPAVAATQSIDSRTHAGPVEITFPSGILARFLIVVGVSLASFDLILQSVEMTIGPAIPGWTQLMKFFDLDRENAIATWYSILLLAIISVTVALIAWVARQERDPMWRYWVALSVMFLAFSIDEQIVGHESVGAKIDNFVGGQGFLLYAWVLPAMVAVAVAAVLFIPFARSLQPSFRVRLFVAAGLYVGGALIMEMVSGAVAESYGLTSLAYETTTSIEEILEIAGISFFLYLLVVEAGRRTSGVTLHVR